jgi:ABC-type transporter lipoprotein component MlaA
MTYKIDCIFGKTLGTYTIEEGKIIFTPTNVGIINVKAKDIGNIDIYAYKLIDEDGLYLSGGRYSVTLIRKEVYEKKLKEQQSLSPRKGR